MSSEIGMGGTSMTSTESARPWEVQRRGLLLLISSPSGAGKTSLSRRLVSDHDDLVLSISATTRAPRPGEAEGHGCLAYAALEAQNADGDHETSVCRA